MPQFFAVFFKPGPNWLPGQSIFEQPLDEHVAHLHHLYQQGKLLMAGPLSDSNGGLTILQVIDEPEARTLIEPDPAILNQTLQADLHPWSPIAWDHVTEASALYELAPLSTTRLHKPRRRQDLE